MRNYKSYEREIFKTLYEHKKINIYFFFKKYSLSPGHIAKFILNCRDKGLVTYVDGIIELTNYGISYIKNNKKNLYLNSNTQWKNVPENMKMQIKPTIKEIFTLSENDIKSFLKYSRKKGAD